MVKVDILVGKHSISSDLFGVAEHWAIGLRCDGEACHWFEIEGASKESGGSRNKINTHTNDEKYTLMIERKGNIEYEGSFQDFLESVHEWNREWLVTHQTYAINGDNCQMHVKDFLRKFKIEETTQNTDIADATSGIGIGVMIFGAVIMAMSALIRGKHN